MDPAAKQFGLFCVVGVVNTCLDVGVYNLLARKPIAWPRIPASVASTTLAMIVGFTLNLQIVFRPEKANLWLRASRYLLVTCFSSYVVQSAVIYLTTHAWRSPFRHMQKLLGCIPRYSHLSNEFIDRNTSKMIAVGVGLVWNFCLNRWYVYANY